MPISVALSVSSSERAIAVGAEAAAEKEAAEAEAEFFAKHRATSLLQRMIEPEEVGNLVAFVASPLASAINGAALRVDGGLTPTMA